MTIADLYSLNGSDLGEKPAVIFEDKVLSHSKFEKRTNQFANLLISMGYKRNDRIAILSKNHIEYPVIIFGAVKAGVTFTPINYRMTSTEVTSLLKHCNPKGLFFSEEFVDIVQSVKNHVEVKDYFNIDCNESIKESYSKLLNFQSTERPNISVDNKDVYYIGYTSGTTGNPKGIISTHESRKMLVLSEAIEFGIGEKDIQLITAPIYHSAPHSFLITQIVMGGTLVIMKEFEPEEVLKNIDKYNVTNFFMAPTMYNFVLELDENVKAKYDTSSVKTLISAGSSLPTRTKERIISFFSHSGLFEFYGASEIGVNIVLRPDQQMETERSVGKPALFNDIKILDKDGNEVSDGEVGEIYVKNPFRFSGYLDNPEETEKASHKGYTTVGDLAKKDKNGFYYIVGRKKDMVISGGVNIYPEEIEDVLYKHPYVREVAIIGVPDEKWGESLKAFIVPRGNNVNEHDIIDYCKQHLASYKKPKSIEFVQDLPRNAAGKVLKTELRKPFWDSQFA
ncbi:hypothetical protein DCC39_13570 [Pueribacillus theae]|uniref:Long-chain fatty acid--CoA ligase n=1 Tax=Pueribacillus theae TaxID=2171751 RepID=A0A2U1JWL0_9BACI|nr:AMP-binding protein [Pueribacillus theae]PWA09208.1 hypothetical protein DCC39_13570 [Pueribacillus theae]